MQPITPVGGVEPVLTLASSQARAKAAPVPASLPVDEAELSPEAALALDTSLASERQVNGLEAQEEITMRVLKQAIGASRSILAGLGLIESQ